MPVPTCAPRWPPVRSLRHPSYQPSHSSPHLPSLVQIGELVLKRVINQFNRAYRRHDKVVCNGVVRFIAQLVNQQVRTVAESRRRGIYCGFTIFLDAVRPVGLAVV
eukprot:scaffold8531_cov130-Isochrysis_galbana.AAC.17